MCTSSFISLYIFYAMTIGYFCHALLHYRISTLRVVFFQLSFWATGRTIGRHVHKPFGFGCLNVTCTALCNQWSFFFMFFVFTIYTKLLFWEKERTKKTCGVPWRVLFARLKCAPSHFAFMNTFPTFLGNQSWLLLTSCPWETVCVDCLNRHIYIQCICWRWFKAHTKGTIFCRCVHAVVLFHQSFSNSNWFGLNVGSYCSFLFGSYSCLYQSKGIIFSLNGTLQNKELQMQSCLVNHERFHIHVGHWYLKWRR